MKRTVLHTVGRCLFTAALVFGSVSALVAVQPAVAQDKDQDRTRDCVRLPDGTCDQTPNRDQTRDQDKLKDVTPDKDRDQDKDKLRDRDPDQVKDQLQDRIGTGIPPTGSGAAGGGGAGGSGRR